MDNFYYLKNISPFLSPLYIVGITTPILAITAITLYRRKDISVFDTLFGLWSLLIFISLICMFIFDPLSVTFLEYFLKLSMPVYIFFFLRLLVRSLRDLDGIMQAFLYSSLFVVAVFLYELVVNPIKVLKTRDLERIQGYYGDVMNYAIYLTQGFLIICYFYFRKKNIQSVFTRTRNLIITAVICIAALFKISHTASYAVFLTILFIFILFNLKTNRAAGFLLILVIVTTAYFFGGQAIEQKITPLLKTDIAVYEGKKANERLLHGRVGRWKEMWEQFSNFPVGTQFFGMPTTLENSYAEVSTGAHNDFVRILFFTGYFGVLLYIMILAMFFMRLKYLSAPQQFLAYGAISILILFSISTCPTLYAPMLYVIYPVICYVALPRSILNEANG